MLLDSNIVIYAADPAYPQLRQFVIDHNPLVSAVSYVESLGFHNLAAHERRYLESFFRGAKILDVTWQVIERATSLRQRRRMSLGDSLIAATALVWNLTLVTRNVSDFQWIGGLSLLNPLAPAP